MLCLVCRGRVGEYCRGEHEGARREQYRVEIDFHTPEVA
jgi:hypothetical protein